VDTEGTSPANKDNERVKLAMVELLLMFKADVDALTSDGFTPLMIAVQLGYPTICAKLIKAGADVNLREKSVQNTALIFAEQNGRKVLNWDVKMLAVVNILLKAGADPAATRSARTRCTGPSCLSCR